MLSIIGGIAGIGVSGLIGATGVGLPLAIIGGISGAIALGGGVLNLINAFKEDTSYTAPTSIADTVVPEDCPKLRIVANVAEIVTTGRVSPGSAAKVVNLTKAGRTAGLAGQGNNGVQQMMPTPPPPGTI
jgi:hypothetical protein